MIYINSYSQAIVSKNSTHIFFHFFHFHFPVISQLRRAASQTKIWLKDALSQYLQDSGVRYADEKSGNNQKKCYKSLKPLVNDIVLFKDSEKKKRFGIIVEILLKNQVMIRSILNSVATLRQFHVRVLILLYRPQEWINDIPSE